MNWLREFYTIPLRALAVMVGVFFRNRRKVTEFVKRGRLAAVIRGLIVATMLIWLVVWMAAGDADRARLRDALQDYLSSWRTTSAQGR